jgi:hypothetical protein
LCSFLLVCLLDNQSPFAAKHPELLVLRSCGQ